MKAAPHADTAAREASMDAQKENNIGKAAGALTMSRETIASGTNTADLKAAPATVGRIAGATKVRDARGRKAGETAVLKATGNGMKWDASKTQAVRVMR